LEPALAGPCSRAEDLEDQPGTVDHFGAPGALEIPLLHWRKRRIDDNEARFVLLDERRHFFDGARADQGRRPRPHYPDHARIENEQIDRGSKSYGLREARLRRAGTSARQNGMQDDCPPCRLLIRIARSDQPAAASSSEGSNRFMGAAGITVEIACL